MGARSPVETNGIPDRHGPAVARTRRRDRGAVPRARRTPAGHRVSGGRLRRAGAARRPHVRQSAGGDDPRLRRRGMDLRARRVACPDAPRRCCLGACRLRTSHRHGDAVRRRVPDVRARRAHRPVPRRGRPRPRRGGRPAVLAGDHVRRHRPARRRDPRAGGGGPVPHARRAAARHRLLRGHHGRRPAGRLHQPTRAGAPGHRAGGVGGRSERVDGGDPPGRPRARRRGESHDRADGRTVLGRVPHVRARRPHGLVPRRGRPRVRRERRARVLAGRDDGHHPGEGDRGPARRGRVALPRARRADAHHHLHRRPRRSRQHPLHQPADHRDPRLHAGRVVRGPRALGEDRASRRRRARGAPGADAPRRDLPVDRAGRPYRLGARSGAADPRRDRGPEVLAGRARGHHAATSDRGAGARSRGRTDGHGTPARGRRAEEHVPARGLP